MPDAAAIIRDNLQRVLERIEHVVAQAGRPAGSVRLVGVTKYVGAAEAGLLLEAGCQDLGESRPQQLWDKAAVMPAARWHMIGHLQRNKIARTLPLATLVHSIDSHRSLETLNKAAEQADLTTDVLLEVNCSGDPEKHGIVPDGLAEIIDNLGLFPHVRVRGLMTMAAREGGPEVARKNFEQLRNLRDEHVHLAPKGTTLDELSMGMTGDFEAAIAEGSTIVRIGSALWQGLL